MRVSKLTPAELSRLQFYKKYFGSHRHFYTHFWLQRLEVAPTKTVVHIPARLESTRLSRKVLLEIEGIPLVAYSILAACNTPGVDRVIVNTESEEIKEIAEAYGAEVPFLRPAEFAKGSTPVHVADYAMGHMITKKYPIKKIIHLYPTSPFRTVGMLNRVVSGLDKVAAFLACCPTSFSPDRMIVGQNGDSRSLFSEQDLELLPPTAFKTVGVFQGANYTRNRVVHYEMIKNPLELIDIDTAEDLELAREAVRRGLYKFDFPLRRIH